MNFLRAAKKAFVDASLNWLSTPVDQTPAELTLSTCGGKNSRQEVLLRNSWTIALASLWDTLRSKKQLEAVACQTSSSPHHFEKIHFLHTVSQVFAILKMSSLLSDCSKEGPCTRPDPHECWEISTDKVYPEFRIFNPYLRVVRYLPSTPSQSMRANPAIVKWPTLKQQKMWADRYEKELLNMPELPNATPRHRFERDLLR